MRLSYMWMKTCYHMEGWAPGIALKEAIGNLEKSYSWLFFIYINFSFLLAENAQSFLWTFYPETLTLDYLTQPISTFSGWTEQ